MEMQLPFSLRQDLTFREFLSSTLYCCFSRRMFKLVFWLFLATALLNLYWEISYASDHLYFTSLLNSVLLVLALCLAVLLYAFLISFFIYKSRPEQFKNVFYHFTSWGVLRSGKGSKSSEPWQEIMQVRETKAFFLLFIGITDFYIIQKRMFKSLRDLDDFRRLIKEHVRGN